MTRLSFIPFPSLGMAWSNAAVAGCVGGIVRSVEEDFGVADVAVAAVELGAADEEAGSLSAAVEEEGGRERRRA